VHLGPLDELAAFAHGDEGGDVDEVVLDVRPDLGGPRLDGWCRRSTVRSIARVALHAACCTRVVLPAPEGAATMNRDPEAMG
jgi:hypothetical protein